jgi:pyruvate dehydrogenase (quinone)
VLDNSGFQFVHIEMEEAGIQPYGTKFANPNFAKVADSIGLTGIRVEDPGEVRDAVIQLLATPGPALLDAVVEPYALSLPSHVSFGEAEGFSLSLAKQALSGNHEDVVQTIKQNVHLV